MTEVAQLADELLEVQFDADPLWPALLGVDMTRPGLGDMTEEAERHTADRMRDILDRASALDPAELAAEDRTTRDVVIAHARAALDEFGVGMAELTVTDLFVAPAAQLLSLLPMLSVGDETAMRAYLDRLAAVPDHLEQALDRHRAGVLSGRTPVKHLVEAAIAHLDRYLSESESDPLLQPQAPESLAGEFDAVRASLLAEVVRPAFATYRDGLAREIAPHARTSDRPGLCWLPGGEDAYRTLAGVHTTTSRSPAELHDTGRALIDELAGEYTEVGSRVFGTRELGEIFDRLRTDPELRWPSADALLDDARAAIGRAEREAPRWFGSIPPQPWVVDEVPAAAAPGAPAAYYVQPATDGSRPGTYFANTYKVTERFKHTSEATAFHEVIPGHHFQLSTAQLLAHLPLLRKLGGFTAYIEGWGLYTERLAREMGLYSDDVAVLGMLANDSMRAGRLVVDTGLHAKGWSRQQAVDYLAANTPMPLVEVESEVDRYIAYPGQALSYMVGRLEIQRVRAMAERSLGADFDIREFHDRVLGCGAVPLAVLERVIGSWASGEA
ncbi:DUF885 domain-containing protein [Haloechinothrix sp. YIM 98757]|uniref:DUF885 domain-containing protein n=1 Tax=Haloechinothrix aidingensis TaxID=2752311 RepID=A0A838A708_9PSEU|nr:DUF885 domain-containing protein [Haloechinothrix aidingensis]MBA0124948.1 DUF885 domain-containing protein [Haloechinothrix aidingensis]